MYNHLSQVSSNIHIYIHTYRTRVPNPFTRSCELVLEGINVLYKLIKYWNLRFSVAKGSLLCFVAFVIPYVQALPCMGYKSLVPIGVDKVLGINSDYHQKLHCT